GPIGSQTWQWLLLIPQQTCQWLSRHRQSRGHLDRHRRAQAAGGGGHLAGIVLVVETNDQDCAGAAAVWPSGTAGSFRAVSSGEPRAPDDGAALRVPCLVNPSSQEAAACLKQQGYAWLDYQDPSDENLDQLAELVSLHPLTVQDARMFGQRPKLEEYQ